jgi:hypothetical protein
MSGIEERLDRIEKKLDALLAAMKGGGASARPATGGAAAGGEVDADIDGPRGDPEVRFVPKRWTGQDYKGQKFSTCEPEFLDLLADAYEWFAQRDDESNAVDKNGTPKSRWSRLDAARARAWSARLRGGAPAPSRAARPARASAPANGSARRPPAPDMGGDAFAQDDNDIPF